MMWKNFSAGVLSVALMAASTPVWAAEEVSPVVTVTQGDVVTAVPAEKTTKASETNKPQAATEQPAVESENTDKASVAGKTDEAALNSRRIMINLASRSLALYEGTKKIRLYPIGPGKPGTPTPVGYFSIRSKDVNPTWTDPENPENSIASGESNPLGYRWMEIQGNYGIHGTNKPESIGHYVSNGCIRMNEKDVEALFELVKIGTPVEITYNRIVVEKTPDDTVAFYIYPDGYDRQPLDVAEVTRWLAGFGVQNFISDEDIQKKIEALTNELADYVQLESERYSKLCAQIYALNTVFELKLNAAIKSEEDYFIFVGWIKADYEETFMQRSKKFDDIMVECEDPGASIIDKIPISLKNNWLFRPFSYFVEMFGLPAYTEIDPTPLFAITYSLMFGLMFADLGQGLVVILIGFLMHKFKKMPLGQILMRCGIFSCIFGAVFGSVFGMEDLLDGVYKSLGINLLPIKVFENTTKILILAISAGVFLMLLVMLIHTICSFKLKQYADAIFSANGIAGILAYSSMVFLATDFMANDEVKQKISVVNKEAVITTLIVGVVMMFFYEFVKEKLADKSYKLKPGSYLLSNIIELFESILSFFSNTVSYLRLGAFVLVHAGMMMVVTTLAGEKVNVTFVIVMILGNALVIALEALLTGIQSLRLQFYEMFSRYYSGQGRAFTPVNIYEEKD